MRGWMEVSARVMTAMAANAAMLYVIHTDSDAAIHVSGHVLGWVGEAAVALQTCARATLVLATHLQARADRCVRHVCAIYSNNNTGGGGSGRGIGGKEVDGTGGLETCIFPFLLKLHLKINCGWN